MGKKKLLLIVTAAVICAVAIVAVIVLHAGRKKESYRVIKVCEVDGTAYVKRSTINNLQVYENMLLESGDAVTLESGSMTLKLDDDKYVYVEEQTEFTIVAEGDSSDGRTRIELKKGAITNEIENKLSTDSSYEVNTPNSTMAVRGTIFRVEVTFDEKGVCYTKVSVLEGTVESRLVYADGTVSGEPVMVEAGYEVVIYQDDKNTDYVNGGVTPIDFSKLPKSVMERYKEIIDTLKGKYPDSDITDTATETAADIEASTNETTTEISTEQSTAEATTEQSTAEVTTGQSTAEVTTGQSTTEATTEQSTTEATTGQSTTEATTEQSTTEVTTEQETTEVTTEQSTTETTTEQAEYTVTFYYNGSVFGTQSVKSGELVSVPLLMPESSGSWDYDFTKPVTSDTSIKWKK